MAENTAGNTPLHVLRALGRYAGIRSNSDRTELYLRMLDPENDMMTDLNKRIMRSKLARAGVLPDRHMPWDKIWALIQERYPER